MNSSYGRDLDLNLLRVFVVVAEAGSVTQAAALLYLTQPAVSASLRRLQTAIGAPLFVRQGRGLVLTRRGEQLLDAVRPRLAAIVEATLVAPPFDPSTSDRVVKLGLSDSAEPWLLPRLLRRLGKRAPSLRLVCIPVQFRTVGDALGRRAIEAAVTVADELGPSIVRKPLYRGGFVVLFDPKRVQIGERITVAEYYAHEHVIVSYNGDLRGIVEDAHGRARNVRCSVSSFDNVGAVVDNAPLLATVPELVAQHLRSTRPHLRTARLPFSLPKSPVELLWPRSVDDDAACRFVRQAIIDIYADASTERKA